MTFRELAHLPFSDHLFVIIQTGLYLKIRVGQGKCDKNQFCYCKPQSAT